MKKILIASLFLFAPALAFAAPPSWEFAIINLVPPPVVTVVQGHSYQEPGYSVTYNDEDIYNGLPVTIGGTVDTSTPGTYTLSYDTSSLYPGTAADTQYRQVNVVASYGMTDPCVSNRSCPCPISADPITGDPIAWKQCVVREYPKLSDGATLVCRLRPLWPGETVTACADDQAGFGEMIIRTDGSEENVN